MNQSQQFDKLFEEWKREHQVLERLADDLSHWMNDDFRRGEALLAEATARLRGLHERLNRHFRNEDDLTEVIAESKPDDSQELNGLRRLSSSDHLHLSQRLRELISRLDNAQSELRTRQEAVDEFNLIVDAIEQHEEQEAAQVSWLRPRPGESPES